MGCPALCKNQPASPNMKNSRSKRINPGTLTTVFPERLLSSGTLKIPQIEAKNQEVVLLKDFHAHSPAEYSATSSSIKRMAKLRGW